MTIYYHVADAAYRSGEDLLSFNAAVDAGLLTNDDWRWEHARGGEDAQVVSLFATAGEALTWIDYGAPRRHKVVEVSLPASVRILPMREGDVQHPAVVGKIAGRYCRVIPVRELRRRARMEA